MFEVAAQGLDFVAVLLQELVDVGFANGDVAGGGKPAVTDVGDSAAACFGHACLEAENFGLEPFGLLWGIVVVAAYAVR